MKYISLLNSNKLEGKTVREIDEEQLSGGRNYGMLLAIAAGALLVLLVLFISWQVNSRINYLRIENRNLIAENAALKEEVNTLQNQLTSIKKTGKVQPLQNIQPNEIIQNDYIYYVIKPRDTLGDVSNKYYGVPIYGPGLAKLNGLKVNSTLQVGQIIRVPIKPDKLEK